MAWMMIIHGVDGLQEGGDGIATEATGDAAGRLINRPPIPPSSRDGAAKVDAAALVGATYVRQAAPFGTNFGRIHRTSLSPRYAAAMSSGKDRIAARATPDRRPFDQGDSTTASREGSIDEAGLAALLAIAATETLSGPRTTIYRRWATKDRLVGAVLYRPFHVEPGDESVEAVVVTAVGLHLANPSRDCLGLLAQRHLPDRPWKLGAAAGEGNSGLGNTTSRDSAAMPAGADAPSDDNDGDASEVVAAQIMLWSRIEALRVGHVRVGDTARIDALLLVQRLCRLADSTEKSWAIEKAIANAQEWCRWLALPPLALPVVCQEAAERLRGSSLRNGPGGHDRMQHLIAACTAR